MKTLSVIIPVYNNNLGLNNCISTLLSGIVIPDEIIVVDDGSDLAPRSESSIVKVISINNSGPARARNIGANLAEGEYLYFIDSDCWVDENTIAVIKDWIASNTSFYGSAGPYGPVNDAKILSTYLDFDLELRYCNIEKSQVFVHGTYNLLLKRNIFMEVGGFDINFPRPSGEDFDLVLRITHPDKPLYFNKDQLVYTSHETSIKRYLTKQLYRGFDRIYYYKKNISRISTQDYYTIKSDYLNILVPFFVVIGFFYPLALFFVLIVQIYNFFLFIKKGPYRTKNYIIIAALGINMLRFILIDAGLLIGLLFLILGIKI